MDLHHITLLASYNTWMNAKLYAAAERLSAEEFGAERDAFFGSLLGTLNHLVVGDTLWLQRFATHPANHPALDPIRQQPRPAALDEILHHEFDELAAHRRWLDAIIEHWATSLTTEDLTHVLHYANLKGVTAQRPFPSLVLNFFNHQTHHRGQATTLLFQAGQDVGVTDLLALIDDV